jgi:hypothetical protein
MADDYAGTGRTELIYLVQRHLELRRQAESQCVRAQQEREAMRVKLEALESMLVDCETERDMAQSSWDDEHEAANHSGGILSDVCDVVFADADRAAKHGYDGVLEQCKSIVAAHRDVCDAVVAYANAIESCANDPSKMATFQTAQDETLDDLYDAMIVQSNSGSRKKPAPMTADRIEELNREDDPT